MAINSIGYAGSVTDAEWARLIPLAGGSEYSVADPDSFRASIASGDRNVDISIGTAAGYGVVDENDAPVTVNIPSVGSGSRWDMIGLHRDWGTGTTTVVVVTGSASKVLPARDHDPGVLDVQPLWLVRVAAGQATVQEFVDLRVFSGNGGAWAADDLVRSYVERLGTSIVIGSTRWDRRLIADIPTWVRSSGNLWVPNQLLKLGEAVMANGKWTTTSRQTLTKLTVNLPTAQIVDVYGKTFWSSPANAAGTDELRLNGIDGVALSGERDHNAGDADATQWIDLFARIYLPAGNTTIFLVGWNESTSAQRFIWGARITIWATS